MKRIAVSGKGGSGKSSIAALLAKAMRARGYRVLVVDSDESNPGLYRKLGLERRPAPLLGLVGGKQQVFQTFSDVSQAPRSILTQEEIRVADIPVEYIVEREGIRLVCVGKILQSLEGCACPMGVLSREFLGRLALEEDEVAIVDMEAGIEHFGRGVETSIDSMLIVTEPSFDSVELAEKMNALAAEVEIGDVWTILNKVPSDEIASTVRVALESRGVPVLGSIGYDPEIFQSGLKGQPIRGGSAESDIARIADRLV
ncbi:MAG: P-loop NTPase [Anaerolineae bacterium]|jgi:CO dehydrogenase maturation factor